MMTNNLDKKQLEVLKNMTGPKRLKVAMNLNNEARKIKAAYIRMRHQDWSDEQVDNGVKRIFLHATT